MPNSKLSTIVARVALAVAIAGGAGGTAIAEEPKREGVAMSRTQVAGIVSEIRRTIADNYVIASKIPAIDKALAADLEAGRFDGLDGRPLAEALSASLFEAARDKHLAIQFDPQRAAMMKGPMGDEITEGPEWEQMARGFNHGFREMRVLEGNVRYANLEGFVWTGEKSAEAFDTTMRFLKEGDAAIIDLRYNGGGSPKAITYLLSHFVAPGTPLMTFYMGGGKTPEHEVALAALPAGRMTGKPLYVLTSRMSISAAEAFAAIVRSEKLGEVVGETTAGAAYRNSYFPVAGRYLLSVSVGRGVVGEGDWEGTGIAPTVAADAGQALDTAHLHALRKVAAAAAGPDRHRMEAKAALLDAQLHPVKPALPLEAYAGGYGDRTISLDGGGLHYQRQGGPKTALVPLGDNLFIVAGDPSTRVEFAASGATAKSLDVIRSDGSRQTQERR
jgi:hypothetical protein